MLRFGFYLLLAGALAASAAVTTVLWLYLPQLPDVETLREVRLQVPLRIYTADGELMAEYGEKRRAPVAIEAVPDRVVNAFLAAEDDKFYSHPGVDLMALTRAVIELARTGEKRQGGSTITMQVARNFFLTRDRTYERKLKEILLALKIERALSKDEILELYLNKIFLGHRAYGIGAAASVYYGVPLDELSIAQAAMLAALPKAPSDLNPVSNPDKAVSRRHYVLTRMRALGMISGEAFAQADAAPVSAKLRSTPVDVNAPYVAEMARSFVLDLLGPNAYTDGYRVYTTVRAKLQRAADRALVEGLVAFTERHGYRGPEGRLELPQGLAAAAAAALAPVDAPPAAAPEEAAADRPAQDGPPATPGVALTPEADDLAVVREKLAGFPIINGLVPGVVLAANAGEALVMTAGAGEVRLRRHGVRWARPYFGPDRRGARPEAVSDVVDPGDVVRLREMPATTDEDGAEVPGYWRLAAIPEAESALVSMDPDSGRILALKGGFSYAKSKFNRAVQARRQPGSNFKPFIYSAAIASGFTPASFVNDAPIVFDAPGLESVWRPENYSGKYYGPTRLRTALAKSRNLVSIRLLREIGIEPALDHIRRFGFDVTELPRNLSLSLGSGELAPVDIARGYAVFANGGYLVTPHVVAAVETADGERVYEAAHPEVCRACDERLLAKDGEPRDVEAQFALGFEPPAIAPRVLDGANAWIMTSMLGDVIQRGTGVRARTLGRSDLAGKTGTTNDQKDAWFTGFNHDIVTTVWVGYDSNESLGRRETGASAALPLWIDYMAVALEDIPERAYEKPGGIVAVRIDPNTGLRAKPGNPDAVFEYFTPDSVPDAGSGTRRSPDDLNPNQLF